MAQTSNMASWDAHLDAGKRRCCSAPVAKVRADWPEKSRSRDGALCFTPLASASRPCRRPFPSPSGGALSAPPAIARIPAAGKKSPAILQLYSTVDRVCPCELALIAMFSQAKRTGRYEVIASYPGENHARLSHIVNRNCSVWRFFPPPSAAP